MRLSIVIITFNRADRLAGAVRSVRNLLAPPGWDFELVVVDNNSRDHTRQLVETNAREASFPIQYVLEPRQGTNYARNAGIAHSKGEFLAFIDDDNTLAPDWLAGIHKAIGECSGAASISGPILPVFPGLAPGVILDWIPFWCRGPFGAEDFGSVPTVIEPPNFPHEMNIVVPRAVFAQRGGFGTRMQRSGRGLLSNDGLDFINRIRADEGRCMYHPAPLAYHHVPESRANVRFLLTRTYWQGISDARCDPVLESLPRMHLLRSALREFGWLARTASGESLSPRRARWHFNALTLEQRCRTAHRLGLAAECLRTAVRRPGRR